MEAPSTCQPCKLFIGGLSAQTTTEVLRGHFTKYGRIVDAVVMSQRGRPRGFGFVTFAAPQDALAALAEPQWLHSRFVDVKRAVPGEQLEERASPNKIFVGGLPPEATTEDLRACFAEYGPIADAVVMADRRSKRSRGFGFVRFAGGTQGARATEAALLDAANHRMGGKWVDVKRASPAALLEDLSANSSAKSSEATAPTTIEHWQGQQKQRQQRHEQKRQDQQEQELQEQEQEEQQEKEEEEQKQSWKQLQQLQRQQRDWHLRHAQFLWPWQEQASWGRPPLGLWGGSDAVALMAGGENCWAEPSRPGLWGVEAAEAAAAVMSWASGAADSPMPRRVEAVKDPLAEHGLLLGGGYRGLRTDAGLNSPSVDCSTSASGLSDDDDGSQENRPATGNRAVTPPPGMAKRNLSPPPGLGIMASPMKVECHSKFPEAVTGVQNQDGLGKSRLWAW